MDKATTLPRFFRFIVQSDFYAVNELVPEDRLLQRVRAFEQVCRYYKKPRTIETFPKLGGSPVTKQVPGRFAGLPVKVSFHQIAREDLRPADILSTLKHYKLFKKYKHLV